MIIDFPSILRQQIHMRHAYSICIIVYYVYWMRNNNTFADIKKEGNVFYIYLTSLKNIT